MNVHAHLKGRKVYSLPGARALLDGFPGWGSDEAFDYCGEVAGGLEGVIQSVNSHGMAPYTRYSIKWETGDRTIDGTPGNEFSWSK